MSNQDPIENLLERLQVTQNKCARFLHGSTLLDKINMKTIYKETKLLSVNQINAQIKLVEVWKSLNLKNYPIQWSTRSEVMKRTGLKDSNKPELQVKGRSHLQTLTFSNDAAKIWNEAPKNIRESKTLVSAKKYIKLFVQTLPI